MTISLALRDHPSISQKRKKQVKKAARQMGYHPNAMATALAYRRWSKSPHSSATTLAWLNFWPDPRAQRTVPLFQAFWSGAVEAAEALGYRIEEFDYHRDLTPTRLKNIYVARGIQGIILPPQRPPVQRTNFDFDWSRFAAVRIGQTVPYPLVHMVTPAQASNMMLAFQTIREKGYARIGHVSSLTIARYAYFDAGFLKAQAFVPKHYHVPMLLLDDEPQPTEQTLSKIDRWMKKHHPDAILSPERNLKQLIEAAGYRVPEDVGLAATSVKNSDADAGIFEQPEEVGSTAVKTLVSLLQRGEFGIPKLPHDIMVRGIWEDGKTLPPR